MSPFQIVEHVVPCTHIREYPRAVSGEQETVLHLHVKQYIPMDNPNPQSGDVTILAAHANGFPKELYEPLWEDLYTRSQQQGWRVRSIWITDVAQQGQSGVLNEDKLGNDPNWMDHSRDLLNLVNMKRGQMPRPIIGIGHSMGGNNLMNLALIHPRLLTTLIMIDPVAMMHSTTPPEAGPNPAYLSTFRRDFWQSKDVAVKSHQKSRFYKKWDPRVLDRWLKYGLREMPTPLYPLPQPSDNSDPKTSNKQQTDIPLTLTTTRHQEVFTFLRPNYDGQAYKGKSYNRKLFPDINPAMETITPFYRAESPATFFRLPELRPSVFYVFGEDSDVNFAGAREEKLKLTGIGVGGSGGVAEGRVSHVTYSGVGHLVAMEAVDRTAKDVAEWVGKEMQIFREDQAEHERYWVNGKNKREKQTVDEQWEKAVSGNEPGGKKKRATKL